MACHLSPAIRQKTCGTSPILRQLTTALPTSFMRWDCRPTQDLPTSTSLINTGPNITKRRHLHARELVLEIEERYLGPVRMQGVVPKFSATPGEVRHAGRGTDTDNDYVFRSILGLSDTEYAELQRHGIS